jgi:MarR-like DNA-binding transcriptional regulator SgrR of sgrS sRNA
MRRLACRLSAIASLAALATLAATRPRYGGTLHVQLSGPAPGFAPGIRLSLRDRALFEAVAETLVRVNERGEPGPLLATSWHSDAEKKWWRFILRTGVLFHDGTPLTPAVAASAISKALGPEYGATVTVLADGIRVVAERSLPELPLLLAGTPAAIVREAPALVATGPFRVETIAGKLLLIAFEDHWAGRPFLDAIELVPYTAQRSAAGVDVWEIPAGSPRRNFPDRMEVWSSAPAELLAIENAGADAGLVSALSFAVDRDPMATVLTQRRAEASAAVLPQWMTGYSFVFSMSRDLPKARQLLSKVRLPPLVLSYEASDALARIIAERIVVNARDAGIVLIAKPDPAALLRLRRFPLLPNAAAALGEIASDLGIADVLPRIAADTARGTRQASPCRTARDPNSK